MGLMYNYGCQVAEQDFRTISLSAGRWFFYFNENDVMGDLRMMSVQSESLQWIGWRLIKPIYSSKGSLLLPAPALLTDERLERLAQHHIHLTIDDVEPVQNRSKELIAEAISEIKRIFDCAHHTGKIPIDDIQTYFVPRIEQIINSPQLIQLLIELQELDDYTYQHNVAVGVLSTLIGKWLEYDEDALALLSVAASLHDIGKVKIPGEILNKPGKLTSEEFSLMKLHAQYGYDILKQSDGVSERVAKVALQHHEREDGSGYPYGLKGKAVDPMSKIVAVADVFHAMTSKRVYKEATPFYQVLGQMMDNAYGLLDTGIVTLFMRKVMDSLVGSRVLLSDDTIGIMVMNCYQDPANPLIRRDDQFVDLSQHPDLNIIRIL
jgi:HD-GYP domain-containing protein (c-di-GMP phosphodiesterase class II)